MKIVITATAPEPTAAVDPRFGRAQCFMLYDTETKTYSVVDNTQNLNAPQGAGIQAGQTVATAGADWVLTGHCGPKAFRVLQAAGIKIAVNVKGIVEEAVAAFEAGDLAASAGADVEGHWV